MNEVERKLLPYIQDVLVTKGDISMETVIAGMLTKNKQTVAAAESCTGGYISHLFTSHANSSSYFIGSVVCYDKQIKEAVLKVDKTLLDEKGTVDKEVAEQMVSGTLSLLKSDYAIAVTGLMGPGTAPSKSLLAPHG